MFTMWWDQHQEKWVKSWEKFCFKLCRPPWVAKQECSKYCNFCFQLFEIVICQYFSIIWNVKLMLLRKCCDAKTGPHRGWAFQRCPVASWYRHLYSPSHTLCHFPNPGWGWSCPWHPWAPPAAWLNLDLTVSKGVWVRLPVLCPLALHSTFPLLFCQMTFQESFVKRPSGVCVPHQTWSTPKVDQCFIHPHFPSNEHGTKYLTHYAVSGEEKSLNFLGPWFPFPKSRAEGSRATEWSKWDNAWEGTLETDSGEPWGSCLSCNNFIKAFYFLLLP